ncbi:MAG TPA: C25 family cysteine peptidase [Patescibacteria group bacterium]|nr:C25 family cysteine peptidase [Patescibacteria group bacterium]
MKMRDARSIRFTLPVAITLFLCMAPQAVVDAWARDSSPTTPATVRAPVHDVLIETPEDADGTAIELRISIPECTLRELRENGRLFHAAHIPGYGAVGRPGEPLLPAKGYYLAVPEGGSIRLVGLESDFETRSGVTVQPAPRPTVKESGSYIGREACLDARLYSSDRFYPASPVEIGSYGYLRDVRVVQLRILPVQFNPGRNEVRVHRRIRVRVELVGGTFAHDEGSARRQASNERPFETIYQNVILNYHPGIAASGRPGDHLAVDGGDRAYLAGNPYKVSIEEDGIYRIDYQNLIDAGADLYGVDPTTITLYEGGAETAVYVSGEGDGRFDPGDAVYFFGRGNTGPFSRINMYWLSWGSQAGLRMVGVDCCPGDSFPVPASFIDTLHFEENRQYYAALPGGEGEDHWYWEKLIAPGTGEYLLDIPDAASGTYDAEVTVGMYGYTEAAHRVELTFNRYLGADCTWHGIAKYVTSFTVPSRYISRDANRLYADCPSADPFDQVLFNRVEVVYRRACKSRDGELRFTDSGSGPNQFEVTGFPQSDIELFRITNPRHGERMVGHAVRDGGEGWILAFEDTLDGGEYLAVAAGACRTPVEIVREVSSNLLSPAHQADYIVITHPLLIDAVRELVTYRRNEGLAATVVTVDDVYDEFNYGNFDPGAIRDFVSYAYHNWRRPSPAYLLLVGDASCDYRGYLSDGVANLVPTHLFTAQTDDRETSSDDWFGCVAGEDMFPDLMIGRITARNESDVADYVGKVIAYETETGAGAWRKTAVLIADNPDDAGDFPAICDSLASRYFSPAGFDTVKIYYGRYYQKCRQMIVDAIDEGCSFCAYVGHGSNDRWAHEEFFISQDVYALNNEGRYPVVVMNTCKNGWFDYPEERYAYVMAEEFARAPLRGAAACWAFSGLSYAPHAALLSEFLYGGLLFEGNHIFGSAAFQAKVRYLAMPYVYWDQAAMLILFGDPALEMGFETRPDLLVGDIKFRPLYPGAGRPDTLEAIVFNAGRAEAAGAMVGFTHGHPDSIGAIALGDVTLPALQAGGHATASVIWDPVPGIGSYPVYVRVDPGGLIMESCEWNNTDFDTLTVRPPCTPGDTVPPVVVLFVDGIKVGTEFTNVGFTSQSPEITAVLSDTESGIDIDELRVVLNGAAIEDCEIEHGGIGSPSVTVRYHPVSLADDVYTFRVRAADCGCDLNTAEAAVTFVVESTLILRDVSNYPNPCRDGTCFRYVLSQPAREVTIRIYAVTGALLRTIRCPSGGRNCNESVWDGKDNHGNPLSSGVYFYRLTAIGARGRDGVDGKFVVVR